MHDRIITKERLEQYGHYLVTEEKSPASKEKYLRDMKAFFIFTDGRPVTKELVMEYKAMCLQRGYAVRSINSMLASINSFLLFAGWEDCKVKSIRLQRQAYCPEEQEITKAEYMRLLQASRQNEQLFLILQTICATGIRVSELQQFTVEQVKQGQVIVSCKNKTRTIFVPKKLKKILLTFAARRKIDHGAIFLDKNGNPLDRSSIWRRMKRLCGEANVQDSKVFPHNLRKLFARTFYELDKDIAKLADILGHSSINTTRIYIMTSGAEHRRQIERMRLLI